MVSSVPSRLIPYSLGRSSRTPPVSASTVTGRVPASGGASSPSVSDNRPATSVRSFGSGKTTDSIVRFGPGTASAGIEDAESDAFCAGAVGGDASGGDPEPAFSTYALHASTQRVSAGLLGPVTFTPKPGGALATEPEPKAKRRTTLPSRRTRSSRSGGLRSTSTSSLSQGRRLRT